MTTVFNQKPAKEPTLSDVLANFRNGILKEINCVKVGIVEGFDAARQRVTVRIAIRQVLDIENGERRIADYPVLVDCPLVFMGSGASYLSAPVKNGASCLVLFNDSEIDNWVGTGGASAPTTARKHDLSDGFALLGVRSNADAVGDYDNDAVKVQYSASVTMSMAAAGITSIAPIFTHTGELVVNGNHTVNGNAIVTGGLAIGGTITPISGSPAPLTVDADIVQVAGRTLAAGNGVSGTFNTGSPSTVITVVDGIVTSIV